MIRIIILLLFFAFPTSLFAQNNGSGDHASNVVFEQYKQAFLSQDIEQVMALYAQDAILITPDGTTYKGPDEIRATYKKAFNYFPDSLTFQPRQFVVEGQLIYHVSSIRVGESGEKIVPFSAETIFVNKGKIGYHTIAEYYPESDIEPPVALGIPNNWTPQTSSLPRDFAPNLYEGIADYAFAPGMFAPEKEDYFTYVMVLYLPIETDVSRNKLERDLETYFDGLAALTVPGFNKNNAETKVDQFFDSLATRHSVPEDSLRANVKLKPVAGDSNWEKSYNGSMSIYEGMIANKPIALNTKVRLHKCPGSDYQTVFLEMSPQQYSHQLWKTLDEMARQWQCPQ